MLVMIDSMYPSRSPAILDRKRTQDVLMLDNRQPAVQHSSDSAQTSSVPAQPYPKRQRFSVSLALSPLPYPGPVSWPLAFPILQVLLALLADTNVLQMQREEQHPIYVQSSTAVPDRQSCSGELPPYAQT